MFLNTSPIGRSEPNDPRERRDIERGEWTLAPGRRHSQTAHTVSVEIYPLRTLKALQKLHIFHSIDGATYFLLVRCLTMQVAARITSATSSKQLTTISPVTKLVLCYDCMTPCELGNVHSTPDGITNIHKRVAVFAKQYV